MNAMRILVVGLAASAAFFAACGSGGSGGEETAEETATRGGSGSSATGEAATAPADGTAKASATTETKASNTPAGGGSCELKVTGDLTASGKGPGGSSAVGSDYWLTDKELREGLKLFEKFGNANLSDDQVEKNVDVKMTNDPRLYILIVNCVATAGDEEMSVSLLPASESKYRDIPYGPKRYPIASGGIFGGDPGIGEFGVLFTFGDRSFGVSERGELNITKWDDSGIAGTFTFNAKEPEILADGTPKAVQVVGTFSYACTGQSKCKK